MFFDLYLFNLLHSLAGNWWFLDWLFIFLAEYLKYFLLAGAVIFLLRLKNKKERFYFFSLVGLSAILASGIAASAIRFFYPRPRPFVSLQFEPLLSHAADASFPSFHASLFFALAFSFFFFLRQFPNGLRWDRWFIWLAAILGLARVVIGLHWPSDILGGAVVGILSAVVIRKLLLLPAK